MIFARERPRSQSQMAFPCCGRHFARRAQHLALVGHGNGRLRHRHALRAATTRDCNNAWAAATRCGQSRRSMQGPCKPNARTYAGRLCREAMRQRVKAATTGTPVPPKGNKWQYPPRLHVHDTHARPRGQIGIVTCSNRHVASVGPRQRVHREDNATVPA